MNSGRIFLYIVISFSFYSEAVFRPKNLKIFTDMEFDTTSELQSSDNADRNFLPVSSNPSAPSNPIEENAEIPSGDNVGTVKDQEVEPDDHSYNFSDFFSQLKILRNAVLANGYNSTITVEGEPNFESVCMQSVGQFCNKLCFINGFSNVFLRTKIEKNEKNLEYLLKYCFHLRNSKHKLKNKQKNVAKKILKNSLVELFASLKYVDCVLDLYVRSFMVQNGVEFQEQDFENFLREHKIFDCFYFFVSKIFNPSLSLLNGFFVKIYGKSIFNHLSKKITTINCKNALICLVSDLYDRKVPVILEDVFEGKTEFFVAFSPIYLRFFEGTNVRTMSTIFHRKKTIKKNLNIFQKEIEIIKKSGFYFVDDVLSSNCTQRSLYFYSGLEENEIFSITFLGNCKEFAEKRVLIENNIFLRKLFARDFKNEFLSLSEFDKKDLFEILDLLFVDLDYVVGLEEKFKKFCFISEILFDFQEKITLN